MKIIATPIIAKDLQPGDLFSTMGQEGWDLYLLDNFAIGQRVYIRTNNSALNAHDADAKVFKITIEKEPQDAS